MLESEEWVEDAACRGCDPQAFFEKAWNGGRVGSPGPLLKEARTVCRACPVQDECLTLALTTPTYDGVWAGLTPPELQDLRKRMRLTTRWLNSQSR